jgi:uncharacterized protein YjbI with pentapeptide repeats
MANQEHLEILKQGLEVWNKWREQNYQLRAELDRINIQEELGWFNFSGANFLFTDFSWANLSNSDLSKADLRYAGLVRTNLNEADLSEANLSRATLNGAFLEEANLKSTILRGANISKADLTGADLSGADLSGAILYEANLSGTQLNGANLERASLAKAILDKTNLKGANLTNCSVYGVSVWNVNLEGTIQSNLIITQPKEPPITVDNLEVAQFIYLLLNNKKIHTVIDTITSKVVLILGRFTPERKAILDALREELHKHNYTPVLFDFERPVDRDFTETARTLAHLSRFIIADITEPGSIPQELQAIVPDLEVPVYPLLQEDRREYSMFPDFGKYSWVAPVYFYLDQTSLISTLYDKIIAPADEKARELAVAKAKRLERP